MRTDPDPILRPSCILGATTGQVEERVREARQSTPAPGGRPPNWLFVPEAVFSEVLHWVHASRLTCHLGIHRSLQFLQQRFWWPSMTRDTKDYIAACPVCARRKASHRPSAGLLQPRGIPQQPWSHIVLDFVTGLPLLKVIKSSSLWLTVSPRLPISFLYPNSLQQQRPGSFWCDTFSSSMGFSRT